MDKKKIIIVSLISIFIIVLSISWFYETKINCHTKEYILLNQYLNNTYYKEGGDCEDSCLFMEVLEVKSALYYTDDYSRYEDEKIRLYFAGENKLRNDLELKKSVYINWCNTEFGERIRGVYK